MCGIAGILNHRSANRAVDKAELLAIRDAMASRGPDGCGLWLSQSGGVGLAHRRLSLVDLSEAGAQPMHAEDGSLTIVFNGEIYNYRDLRHDLQQHGCRFRSGTDTEVLLHLYAEKGEAMVHELRGMYAFAIWDHRRHRLLLARDPFGIKPLYYADNGRSFRFASQAKALVCGGQVDTGADAAGQVGFFLWGAVPDPYTIYRGVRALPAGTTLCVDESGCGMPRVFCRVCDILADSALEPWRGNPSEMREELRAAIEDSVQHHLMADVPVGVFLSAGLDSATLTATAAAVGSSRLHTVTLGFNEYRGTPNDETGPAEMVARLYGTDHQTRWVQRSEFEADFRHLLASMDQPSVDGVNMYFVSKITAATGLKAAISGIGGDELFAGYPSFLQIPSASGMLSRLPNFGGGNVFRRIATPLIKRLTSPKYAGLFEYGSSYGGAYLLRRGLYMPWELPDLVGPDVARAGWSELQPLVALDEIVADIGRPRLRVSALELTIYMRHQLLRDADWAGMAHSLEIRVPLADLYLLRRTAPLLASSDPPGKREFASCLGKPLPAQVVNRRKTGFSIPVREWLVHGQNGSAARGLRGWAQRLAKEFGLEGGSVSAPSSTVAKRTVGVGLR